jgi:hypothetical protein
LTIQTLKNDCLQRLPFVYIYKLSYPSGSGLRMALPIPPEPIFQGLVPAWPEDNLRGRETLHPGPLSLNQGPSYPSRSAPGSGGKIRQTAKCLEHHGEVLAIKEVLPRSPLPLQRGTSRKWASTSPILSAVSRRHYITANRLLNYPSTLAPPSPCRSPRP